MKESDNATLATAVDPESLERALERDRQEIEIEKEMERLKMDAHFRKNRKERADLIRKISRKYYELANGMVEEALYSEAVDLYSKSISILRKIGNRKAVDSYFNRAITLAMLGYPKMALDDLRVVTRTKPVKADVFFVKGQIFESIGKEKLAERMYKKCLEVDPEFYRAARSLENMHFR